MTRTREGTVCAMYCAECKRPIAVGAPSFAIDGTLTRFRCGPCQIARSVTTAVSGWGATTTGR